MNAASTTPSDEKPVEIDKRWYVIAAEPNMDVRFARDLGERGYETFIALTYSREKTGNRAWVEARLRLSPYVWVCVDYSAGQNFAAVKQTFGFSSAISLNLNADGLNPSEVPESVIKGLRLDQIEDFEAAVRRVRRKECLYRPGELVRIGPDHPFSGYEGAVSSARPGSLIVEIGPNKLPVWVREQDIGPARPFEQPRKASA